MEGVFHIAATGKDIKKWFERGVSEGATHMIVVCDTFHHSDYPVFVKPEQNPKELYEQFNGKNMQKVMEVYDLSQDMQTQLDPAQLVRNF